ncbi:methyl-accepting chemotaxis protein [Marinospirillum perlucidum]|uniref:methyl-accepting chemotaxis protein n=1 Tax=Marinospirillum perlucidum TaxID=1982602 RepID=UPI000DF18141|nr:methyl-accepting chemotaxis protein [Marinospirillum perlucidum]
MSLAVKPTGLSHFWRKLGLQKKFVVSLTLVMLASLTLLGSLAGQLLQKEVDQAVASEVQKSLETARFRSSEWLQNKRQQLQALARHLPGEVEEISTWQNYLTLTREAGGFDLVHIGTAQGEVIQSQPPIELPPGADPRTRPWFIQAQAEQELILTPVYVDLLTGDLNMTLAIPLEQNPEHVLGGDLYISALVDELLDQSLRWKSQLFMLDGNHQILAHKNSELLQQELDELLPDFQLNRDTLQQVDFQGATWLASSIQVPDTDWQFVLLVDAAEVQAVRSELLQLLAAFALPVGLVSALIIFWLTRTLIQPLYHFQEQLAGITQTLDLSRRLEVPEQTEWSHLAGQTNQLLERIDQVVDKVIQSSAQLNTSARHLAYTAGLVSRNSDRQDESTHSMAAAVEEMSSSVAEITSTMEELSTSSTQIADHSQSVVEVANLTLDNSRKGVDAMQQLQSRMGDIHSDNQKSLAEIMELGTKSKQISKVMDLINDLADQTKLIAFNAALEASSAGESGKRFSVVAGEIRRLADSVTDSTREIEERIQEIQDSISRLVITSEKGSNSIQAGMEVSYQTAEDLNALLQAASQTSSAAEQISLSTSQQKTASNQVVVALRDIASASSHNAQSVRHITDISEEMLSMSKELTGLVQAFQQADELLNSKHEERQDDA